MINKNGTRLSAPMDLLIKRGDSRMPHVSLNKTGTEERQKTYRGYWFYPRPSPGFHPLKRAISFLRRQRDHCESNSRSRILNILSEFYYLEIVFAMHIKGYIWSNRYIVKIDKVALNQHECQLVRIIMNCRREVYNVIKSVG